MLAYLNQNAVLHRMTRDINGNPIVDKYGAPVYATPVNIRVRRSPINEEVLTEQGRAVNCRVEYYLLDDVNVNDRLDGLTIRWVEEYNGFSGNKIGVRCLA